jgi:hypothetical protein
MTEVCNAIRASIHPEVQVESFRSVILRRDAWALGLVESERQRRVAVERELRDGLTRLRVGLATHVNEMVSQMDRLTDVPTEAPVTRSVYAPLGDSIDRSGGSEGSGLWSCFGAYGT